MLPYSFSIATVERIQRLALMPATVHAFFGLPQKVSCMPFPGITRAQLRSKYRQYGDLGDVPQSFCQNQRLLH